MAKKYIYPVDTDQFADIRERGLVYVDKTDMVYDLTHTYRYIFLSRPRRFGKSLLCNTFKAYFEGRKELFEGLKIMDLETEWTKHPVLHFSISGLKNLSIADAKSVLGRLLATYEERYGRDKEEITPGSRFRGLIHRAHKQTGKRVVVLIDEYDAPVMRLIHDQEQFMAMRDMLREFYQVVKDEGEHLRFTFFTGVTKFSQLSIFSELKKLNNISMMPAYSGICGITQRELDGVMRPCVEQFAALTKTTVEDTYCQLKRHYDGYHFCEESEDVYNPFSLLHALQANQIKSYWFEAGTMTSLMDSLRTFPPLNPAELDGVELDIMDFNIPIEDACTPIPILYQSGYLSIDTYDADMETYMLHIPNQEVRQSLLKGLVPYTLHRETQDTNALIIAMTRALRAGNLSTALSHLRAYIAGIPYDIIPKKEWDDKARREAFYKLLFYLIFSMLHTRVDTEVKSILGRADIVIQTDADIFVLELKVDDTVDHALAQIDSRDYAAHWEPDGRRLTKCGIRLDSEKRNITAWRSVNAEGEVVDEQTYE